VGYPYSQRVSKSRKTHSPARRGVCQKRETNALGLGVKYILAPGIKKIEIKIKLSLWFDFWPTPSLKLKLKKKKKTFSLK